ncbi:UNVERIFIED_CONTAM: hypothetical protein FKN15_058509 [Acipenser sinensis]
MCCQPTASFHFCSPAMQPAQSYSVRGQRSSGQLTGKAPGQSTGLAGARLGSGERSMKTYPVEAFLPSNRDDDVTGIEVAGVACGSRHTFIWTQSGHAYSFGNNFYAQLGYDFRKVDFKEHQV